jgi:DNA-binding NarL/FixJ family response regulator
MQINLDQIKKSELELNHKSERDGRVRDRIKAVLLNSEGWTNRQIAQALRIDEETIFTHLAEFVNLEKLKPENGGSESKLDAIQTSELIFYLEENTFTKSSQIRDYIFFKYQISYSTQGKFLSSEKKDSHHPR